MCGGGGDKCRSCEYGSPPELMIENRPAWQVFMDIKTQWRAGPAGIIGLDYREMRHAIRDHGLTRTRSLERKIKSLEEERLIHANTRK